MVIDISKNLSDMSTSTLQVVVIPESSDVEFRYVDMMECAMGAKWKQGEPMVKVYGVRI